MDYVKKNYNYDNKTIEKKNSAWKRHSAVFNVPELNANCCLLFAWQTSTNILNDSSNKFFSRWIYIKVPLNGSLEWFANWYTNEKCPFTEWFFYRDFTVCGALSINHFVHKNHYYYLSHSSKNRNNPMIFISRFYWCNSLW